MFEKKFHSVLSIFARIWRFELFVMTERKIVKKSRVIGPWDHKDSVSAKKVKQKLSCWCTFKIWLKEKVVASPFMSPLWEANLILI